MHYCLIAGSIAAKQVFIDGSKRTSSVVTRTFLNLNGYDYVASADEDTRSKSGKASVTAL
jgi:prophage maintenance system killer protein